VKFIRSLFVVITLILTYFITPQPVMVSHTVPTQITQRHDAAPLNIMVLGDSISVGCNNTPLSGWCGDLSAMLNSRGIAHTISAHAISGYSCGALANGFAARFDQIKPNLVIMNCGTNDVPNSQQTRDAMGTSWRIMVEYSHTHGAMVLPIFVQYSNREINDIAGRGWLLPGEGQANDTIYVNWSLYINATPRWFVGLADLQKVPGDLNYLIGGTDGIHPNAFGHSVYASVFYRSMREFYGWPDDVVEPCGLWGHRINVYGPPSYTPCTVMS
jgi:lysophospholipase L1-like esterase